MSATAHDARRTAPLGVALAVALVTGLSVGALTAYAQGWLGDATASLANSAGPWSLAAFVVARTRRRWTSAVVVSIVVLASCEIGYALATEVRGGSNATSTVVFWLAAAALAGPPLGVAAAWSTSSGLLRAAGFGVLGGVLVGEGFYGWTTVAETTDWRYWATEVAVGVLVVSWAAARSRRFRDAGAALVSAGSVASVVFAAGRLV